ncbi:MAG: hypothetical protein JNN28_08825 [Saprospiraceae bacterium]|nr:hypothetical protein [Saprospiraceae bacterium]
MKNDPQNPTDAPENWLRQTLDGYRPEAPADAWQRLAPNLPNRNRRRPIVFWLSGAAVGIAIVAVFFWFLISTAQTIEPSVGVENGQPAVQVISAALPNNLPVVESSKIWRDKSFKKLTNPPSEVFNRPGNVVGEPVFVTTPLNKENKGTFDFIKKTNTNAALSPEKAAPKPAEKSLVILPGKALVPLLSTRHTLPKFQSPASHNLPKKAKAQRYWLGVEAAPSLFIQKNMSLMPGDLIFPETHTHPGMGWQAGVSLAFEPLKTWRIALGIQHLRQMREAQHAATLRLMDGVCLNPHDLGLKEYQFNYAVASGGEQNELTLRLQQQDIGSMMADDEPFTLEMKTTHRSMAWRVPLSIERRFGAGKWHGFMRGGAVVDFSEKIQTKVTHFTEVCQDLCFQSGHLPSVQSSEKADTSVGWLLGAGIERQISRRFALRFEPFMIGQKGSRQYGLNFGLMFSN